MNTAASLTPWSWTIESRDPWRHQCPSSSSLLSTFAAVNVVVSVLCVIFGNRTVIKTCTGGRLGKRNSRWYLLLWIMPVGLQLAANAINAVLIRHHRGYVATFTIAEYMLFLAARPRLSWVVLGLLSRAGGGDLYWTTFVSNATAEVVLQYMTLYTMGRTANWAARQGYYRIGSAQYAALPLGAHLFYAGALYYLIVGSLFVILATAGLIVIMVDDRDHNEKEGTGIIVYFMLLLLLVSTWMGSWLFWAGFVKMAGKKYCPPNLAGQGAVWAVFSLIGITLGGAP